MIPVRSQLMQRVLDDIKEYQDRREITRASLIEKMITKKVPPDKLHANPDDEFSQIQVGPSERIVEQYCQLARRQLALGNPVYEEPIVVEKLKSGYGYLILNGHHRWAGAIKAMVPTVRITIVNPRKPKKSH